MKIRVIDINDIPDARRYSFIDSYLDIPCLFEIEGTKVYTKFKYNDRYYSRIGNSDLFSFVIVEEFKFKENCTSKSTDYIICPFCEKKYSSIDAKESNTEICENCGSVFAYEKDVTVIYTSKKIKKKNIRELKFL